MTSLRDQQREFSARTRDAILVTLQQNGEDWLSSQEIVTALPTIEDLNTWQVGRLLKLMRDQGLVENKAERNFNVWRIKANPDSPRTPYKPADNHPWREKVCQPRTPRSQPIACELPVHLLTPKPRLEEHCPTSLIQEQEEALEIAPAALGFPELVDVTESIEDEPYPPLTQFLIHEAEERERVLQGNEAINERHCTGQCQSKTQLTHADARDDYLRLLITIADDAAVNGEQLKDWPIWTKARALAPHFNLEASYA